APEAGRLAVRELPADVAGAAGRVALVVAGADLLHAFPTLRAIRLALASRLDLDGNLPRRIPGAGRHLHVLDAGEGKHRAGGLVGLRVPLPRVETDEDDPARLVRGLHVVVTNEDGGLVGLELEGVGADDVEGRRIEAGRAGELGERLAGQALRATGKRRVEVGERVRPDVGRVGAAAIEGIVDADLAQKDVPLIVLDRRVPADAAVA